VKSIEKEDGTAESFLKNKAAEKEEAALIEKVKAFIKRGNKRKLYSLKRLMEFIEKGKAKDIMDILNTSKYIEMEDPEENPEETPEESKEMSIDDVHSSVSLDVTSTGSIRKNRLHLNRKRVE
jgi:hypothetical protein